MKENDVIHVKGCGKYWIYERKSGVRGFRLADTNFDLKTILVTRDKNPYHDYGFDEFRQHNPELSDFLERKESFGSLPLCNM